MLIIPKKWSLASAVPPIRILYYLEWEEALSKAPYPHQFLLTELLGLNFTVVSLDRVSCSAEVEQINPDILPPDPGSGGAGPDRNFSISSSHVSTLAMTMTNGAYSNSHALYRPCKW